MFALRLFGTGVASLCLVNLAVAQSRDSKPSPADGMSQSPSHQREEICTLAPSACVAADPGRVLRGPILAVWDPPTSAPDEGSKTSNRFIVPPGTLEARGELAFVAVAGVVPSSSLALGDMTLFRNGLRRAFGICAACAGKHSPSARRSHEPAARRIVATGPTSRVGILRALLEDRSRRAQRTSKYATRHRWGLRSEPVRPWHQSALRVRANEAPGLSMMCHW